MHEIHLIHPVPTALKTQCISITITFSVNEFREIIATFCGNSMEHKTQCVLKMTDFKFELFEHYIRTHPLKD
jgi:hypothetical protein